VHPTTEDHGLRASSDHAAVPAPSAAGHAEQMQGPITRRWTRARLVEPSGAGYVFLGASSGPWRVPPALPSTRRRFLLGMMRATALELRRHPQVERADVFRGLLRPPGTRSVPGQRAASTAFDVVLLVQTRHPDGAAALAATAGLTELVRELEAAGASTLAFPASDVRRLGDVDHDRPGVFLLNYFTADDVETNLNAWSHTAGWFQDQTRLDNSTVLRPLDPAGGAGGFSVVNHCRWDRLRDVLPALVLRPSFRTFVLRTFAEHRIAPHPVLYRLEHSTNLHLSSAGPGTAARAGDRGS